jgi:hypothetical protein
MKISESGLMLGTIVLAPGRRGIAGDNPEITLDGAEERVLALLAIAYGKAIAPGVLGNIRRAAQYWRRGERSLAEIELALTGLPCLPDRKAFSRLCLADELMAQGVSPRELLTACDLDPVPFDLVKGGYNPDQPRVPAGNPKGGQWTSGEVGDSGLSTGVKARHQAPPARYWPITKS